MKTFKAVVALIFEWALGGSGYSPHTHTLTSKNLFGI
jgi:hypothetical protein